MTLSDGEKNNLEIGDPVFCKSIRFYFREYCHCTSIHGFRYFGEKRTYCERIWWFIVFSSVVSVCGYAIYQVYDKWQTSPVLVSLDTRETKISSIPYPAVTICPQSKSILSKYNHSDMRLRVKSSKLTPEEETFASYMNLICDIKIKVFRAFSPSNIYLNDTDLYGFLDKVRRKDIIQKCRWMEKDCIEFLIPMITDEGICYTFNMLDREDLFTDKVVSYKDFLKMPHRTELTWNLDNGYSDNTIDTYPKRVKFPGVKNALEITLATRDEDLDPICKESMHGYKVLLHTPMRFPRVSNEYFKVPLDESVIGSIQTTKISTSPKVKDYLPSRRQCYFNSERKLKYFKIYSQLNCNLECLTDYIKKICNCVRFYMPRENSTKICGRKKERCVSDAEHYFQTDGLKRSMEDLQIKNETKEKKWFTKIDQHSINCDCLPLCNDLTYSVEISQSKWEWEKEYTALGYNKNSITGWRRSKLTLYFRTSQFVTSKRHELYGIIDLVANFGGLLGLCTGFSILSIMELIYFLTLRLFCNIRLYDRWYGPEALN